MKILIITAVVFLTAAGSASAGWTEGKHGSAMEFNGTTTFVDSFGALGNVKTVCFWMKADSTTEKIMEMKGETYIEVSAGTITATGFTSPTIYVDGVISSTLSDTNWHHIAITTDTNVDASAVVIGKVVIADPASTTYFTGTLDDVKVYAYVRSAEEIRLDYNAGVATHLGPSGKSCADDPAACMDYGLVGSWNMDEGTGTTAYDVSDEGNDGSLGAGDTAKMPKWTTDSPPLQGGAGGGSSLQFDGVNDYVDCGNDDSLDITEAITIGAWVKITDFGNVNSGTILGANKYDWHRLYIQSDALHYNIYDGTNIWYKSKAYSFNTDQWYHVCVVGDKANEIGYWYVNGESIGSEPKTIWPTHSACRLRYIGSTSEVAGLFNGAIDSVRVYNRALSAEEVRYHYNKSGPVAEWNFDEGEGQTAYDESSNNNDGTLGNGACFPGAGTCPTWVEGKYGGAMSFDGGDYVDCGNGSSLDITDAITVGAWVKVTSVLSGEGILGKSYYTNATDNGGYEIQVIPTGSKMILGNNDWDIIQGDIPVDDDIWHHCCYTWDGTNIRIYVDGVLDITSPTSIASIKVVTQDLNVGRIRAGAYFNGSIDSVRIYNYARTAEQIRQDYNAGMGTYFR